MVFLEMKPWSDRRKAVTVVGGVTALILAALGGCLAMFAVKPELIERTRIVGQWSGSGGARVELREDGRFEMSGIPRSAIVISFADPPPGKGRLSGSGTWELEEPSDRDTVESIRLNVDAVGSFTGGSEIAELRVARGGDKPVLYFATNVDKWYGFEISKTEQATSRQLP
ncbi:hypothetical protein [Streptomyces microflavus]|uniref:hypothetical protein n=1 Tax=Streptomyces microflavus TaxID=1919 RepID=UPI00367AB01F